MINTYTVKTNMPMPFLEGASLNQFYAKDAPGKTERTRGFRINNAKLSDWISDIHHYLNEGQLIYGEHTGTTYIFTFNDLEAAQRFEERWGAL